MQDDPRYSTLLAMRAKQGSMAPPSPGPPSMDPNRQGYAPSPTSASSAGGAASTSVSAAVGGTGASGPDASNAMKTSFLSPSQVQQLRAQIMAYRMLARNQPLPQHIGLAAQGKRNELQPQQIPPSTSQQQPNTGQGDQQASTQPQPFQRPGSQPLHMQAGSRAPGSSYQMGQQAGPTAQPSLGSQQQQSAMGPPVAGSAALATASVSTSSPIPGSLPSMRAAQPQV